MAKLMTRKCYNLRELYDLLRENESLKAHQIEYTDKKIFIYGEKGRGMRITIKNGNTIVVLGDWSPSTRPIILLMLTVGLFVVVPFIIGLVWSLVAQSGDRPLENKVKQALFDMNL